MPDTRRDPTQPKRELSERQLAQRRAAAKNSTGPKTEAGKDICSRNAWKHGRNSALAKMNFRKSGADSIAQLFGKPCLTTCPMHPRNPKRPKNAPICNLVVDGLTDVGGNCLDKTVYVNAFTALIDAMEEGSLEGMHALLAAEGAASLEILNHIRMAIAENGVMITIKARDKDGQLVYDKQGKEVIDDVKTNPLLGAYTGFLRELGISLPEMLTTPKSRNAAKVSEDNADALQTMLGGIMQRAGGVRPPRALPPGDD